VREATKGAAGSSRNSRGTTAHSTGATGGVAAALARGAFCAVAAGRRVCGATAWRHLLDATAALTEERKAFLQLRGGVMCSRGCWESAASLSFRPKIDARCRPRKRPPGRTSYAIMNSRAVAMKNKRHALSSGVCKSFRPRLRERNDTIFPLHGAALTPGAVRRA
jgi:hypothetical protein